MAVPASSQPRSPVDQSEAKPLEGLGFWYGCPNGHPKLDVAGSSPVSRSNNSLFLCALRATGVMRNSSRDS